MVREDVYDEWGWPGTTEHEEWGQVVGLVKDLDQPRVVRDFDAEIAALLRTVGGAS